MATIYAATNGSDFNTGTLASPYRSIGAANAVAVTGDTVYVTGDPAGVLVYDEIVTFKTGVHYLGDATYQPVLDSNYTKGAGFYVAPGTAPTNVTIENFEIRRFNHFGISAYGTPGGTDGNVIKNCHIHHILASKPPTDYAYGCYFAYGDWRVEGCEIHHIEGPNESTGIWFGYCQNHSADGNVIYSVRKEGIRSYIGNLGRFVNNRIFLCWCGLCPDDDAQSLWANNYVSHCTLGINPKHTNDVDYVLPYWGLADDSNLKYCRFWHNTIHRCSWGQMVLAINTPGLMHKADVRNNIFSGRSPAFLWDAPTARLDPNIVDYNVYSTAQYGPLPYEGTPLVSPIYMVNYDTHNSANFKTLPQVRTDLGWETNGIAVDPQLVDPDVGELDYPDASPVHNAGVDLTSLGSDWGTQMGARGLPDARAVYTPYLLSRVAASSAFGFSITDEQLFNGDQSMPLGSWIVVDLGAVAAINHVFGDNLGNGDPGNAKRVRLELSDDSAGPWTTVLDDETYDSGGTSWKFEIPDAPVGRYARVTFLTSWGAPTVSYYDLRLGLISSQPVISPPTGSTFYPSPTVYPSPTIYPAHIEAEIADERGVNIPTSLGLDRRTTVLAGDPRTTELIIDG